MSKLKITLTKSKFGRLPIHRKTIEALGLKRMHQSVIHYDSPVIRGMVNQVSYLLKVEEVK